MSGSLPTVMTAAGLQPQAPADLRAQLVALAVGMSPGLTANLPASLIEDLASTGTAAVVLCDQARVDLVNSITPNGANAYILQMLGGTLGIPIGLDTNTEVDVQFTGPPGFVIAPGFTVGDGTYQYTVQDGGIIASSGVSATLSTVATVAGSWPVPAGTVTQIVTSVPTGISLAVTNPLAGIASTGAQTETDYRAQVLGAQKAPALSMPSYLRKQLLAISGVQPRLISIRQLTGGGWEVIVGGGDIYEIANAIYSSVGDISTLKGSVLAVEGITQASPGVVTTTLKHEFATGQVINIASVVGMTAVNNTPLTVTVLTPTTFSIGVNTTGYGAYISGGIVTPNLRNVSVTISEPPDTYVIPFVRPPAQVVVISLTWNTSAVNFVSGAAVNVLGAQALVNYVNSLSAGQPMNLFELQATFQMAVASILPTQLLTRMVFTVSIDGIGVAPSTGTGIIAGDPEGYFTAAPTAAIVSQG
jgi:hypothetical protein